MKWTNKGHEFDLVYENIKKLNKLFLFGAGDYGDLFMEFIDGDINFEGYIDNNLDKQGKSKNGLRIYSVDEISKNDDIGIIVTASQLARIGIVEQLEELGYKKYFNYFLIEEFISIYYVYKHDKVYFSNISMLPSTKCNLNCKLCLNFNPFANKPDVRDIEKVKQDIDLFFNAVDKVMLFHISGGETLLYKDIVEVIKYLSENYRERIGRLRMITNGTIVPKDKVIEELSKCEFEVIIDDYREAVPQFNMNFSKLVEKLETYSINYHVEKADKWIDLAPTTTDNSHFSEAELINYFDTCNQSWQELRDGKLYSCNYDGYATTAGINPIQDYEIYDLAQFNVNKKQELIEFRLGYNAKGYTNLCRHCKGFRDENNVSFDPAEQY